jgi:glucose-1-phosphate adenylyltransferase
MNNVLAMILAGGVGSRLMPLTRDRAKPAVPFGGRYRIIDFVLSNFVNSGFAKIKVLTQYKSESLNTHLSRGWRLSAILGQYIEPVPAQQRLGPQWYKGSADAIYQNINIITDEEPDLVAVFGGDHIYKMDVRQMVSYHNEQKADLTVAAIPVPIEEASDFGIIEIDEAGRMIGFVEKPENPPPMPGRPDMALASMGNYLFSTDVLINVLNSDAENPMSVHDFGKSIISSMVSSHKVFVYDFSTNTIPGQPERERGYWRDVGTLGTYLQANMDLVSISPTFDLYNRRWPIRTNYDHNAPAKFVHDDVAGNRVGVAVNSIVSDGCIISGGRIERCVLFPRTRVNSYAHVTESILFDEVVIGRHAKLRRCIIDKGVEVPSGVSIGFNHEEDRKHFHVSDDGIVVVPKGFNFS